MARTALQKEQAEIGLALGINLVFLVVVGVVFWLLGQVSLVFAWAKGYGLFWVLIAVSAAVLFLIERLFRIDPDEDFYVYVGVNLVVSVVLMAGWSAFAALTTRGAAVEASVGVAVGLYVGGFLASYMAYAVLTAFYQGSIYKIVTLPLAPLMYLVVVVWPAMGWFAYGWFFAFFGMGP